MPDVHAPPQPPTTGSRPARTPLAELRERLRAPVDAASLAAFRILFGLVMAWESWRYFHHDWVRWLYVEPTFHFTYYGFGWVRPWPGDGMYWHWAALGVLGACIAAGFCYRAAAVLFFVGFTHVFLIDQANYLNHFYLVCLLAFLLCWVPAHRTWSVDAWLRPRLRSPTVPAWSLHLLRFQVGIVYVYGGVAKLNADWLRGEPLRSWIANDTHLPVIGPWLTEEWMVYLLAYGGLLLDLLVVPLLLWRRTRLAAVALLVVFHLLNAALFSIGIFPWLMLGATALFFEPGWPRRLLRLLRLPGGRQPPVLPEPPPRRPLAAGLVAAVLGCHVALQVLVPLRHFLYPGDPSWNEEGHRFAWHMKLRSKRVEAWFRATARHRDEPNRVIGGSIDPDDYLSPRQVRKMRSRPDMILQFCHHVADDLRARGYLDVRVHARVIASLNGHPPRPLVDERVDLAAQPRTLGHVEWVMPTPTRSPAGGEDGDDGPEEPPPRVRDDADERRDAARGGEARKPVAG